MEVRPREIVFLEAGDAKAWLDALEINDSNAYHLVLIRLERLEDGNLGDWKAFGGIIELRFLNIGPGYRIYLGEHDDIAVLLTAGTKKTQESDIKRAQTLWKGYADGQ